LVESLCEVAVEALPGVGYLLPILTLRLLLVVPPIVLIIQAAAVAQQAPTAAAQAAMAQQAIPRRAVKVGVEAARIRLVLAASVELVGLRLAEAVVAGVGLRPAALVKLEVRAICGWCRGSSVKKRRR